MDDQGAALLSAVIVGFIAVALGFLLFMQEGGFLEVAIEQAIEDGRVIMGMTKDDVISSWGRAYQPEEHSIQVMNVDELASLSWTYESPHRIVHFSSDGIVIWVVN